MTKSRIAILYIAVIETGKKNAYTHRTYILKRENKQNKLCNVYIKWKWSGEAWGEADIAVINRGIIEGFSETLIFEQRLPGDAEVSHVGIWGKDARAEGTGSVTALKAPRKEHDRLVRETAGKPAWLEESMRETVAGNDLTVGEAQITWSPIAHFSFYSEQPGEPWKVFESRGDIIPVFRIDNKIYTSYFLADYSTLEIFNQINRKILKIELYAILLKSLSKIWR